MSKAASKGCVIKQVITLSNWSLIPLGSLGHQCGVCVSKAVYTRSQRAGVFIYHVSLVIFGAALGALSFSTSNFLCVLAKHTPAGGVTGVCQKQLSAYRGEDLEGRGGRHAGHLLYPVTAN